MDTPFIPIQEFAIPENKKKKKSVKKRGRIQFVKINCIRPLFAFSPFFVGLPVSRRYNRGLFLNKHNQNRDLHA